MSLIVGLRRRRRPATCRKVNIIVGDKGSYETRFLSPEDLCNDFRREQERSPGTENDEGHNPYKEGPNPFRARKGGQPRDKSTVNEVLQKRLLRYIER